MAKFPIRSTLKSKLESHNKEGAHRARALPYKTANGKMKLKVTKAKAPTNTDIHKMNVRATTVVWLLHCHAANKKYTFNGNNFKFVLFLNVI